MERFILLHYKVFNISYMNISILFFYFSYSLFVFQLTSTNDIWFFFSLSTPY